MLDSHYLLVGLDALSRAAQTDYFLDGHRAASIIAAYYLCQELALPDEAVDVVESLIESNWMHTDLCAPLPPEPADAALTDRIIECLEQSLPGLRQAGHNVIFPSLALKGFRDMPGAVTPSRVDGICRLITAFTRVDAGPSGAPPVVDVDAPADTATVVLSELLTTLVAFDGRGQGWSGHLLTYARALLDLHELGYGATARRGVAAFTSYIERIRQGPLDTDKPRPEHVETWLRPHEAAYWETRRDRSVALGHVFKYPYAFYGLLKLTPDASLAAACMQAAYRIF